MTCLVLLAGAACSTFPKTWSEFDDTLDRAPYVQQDLSQAWVGYPGAQLVLERRYRNVSEQRILLPNTTTLPGDNFVFMMTQGSNLTSLGRFQPLTIWRRNGEPPLPFTSFRDLTITTEEDVLGTLHWARWTNGTDLTCVLAFRRLDASSRVVPPGTGGLDVMMRNCLRGSVEEALRPLAMASAGFAGERGALDGRPQMLSPLAAPIP